MTRIASQSKPAQPGTAQSGPKSCAVAAVLFLSVVLGGAAVAAQSANSGTAPAASAQTSPRPATSAQTSAQAQARARRRAARRRQRLAEEQQAAEQRATSPAATQVGPTSAQRTRDAQILAAQKAQSNASAAENDALTRQYIEAQNKQQAEPRIQDAPGPDSTPLPGDPAVMPAQTPNQTSDPPRIQDAPGPAQTLPKAPPATAPAPAPQP